MGEFQLVKKKGGNGGDTSSALVLLPYPSSCFSLFLPLSPSLEPFLTSLEAERPRSVPKRESSNWALISRVFCPVASSIASATSSRADAADAATTALRRRRWEAGLLLRGSNAGAAAVLLVEGADPRGAAAAAASAGEARTLAARRCMAFFDRKKKGREKKGMEAKRVHRSCLSTAIREQSGSTPTSAFSPALSPSLPSLLSPSPSPSPSLFRFRTHFKPRCSLSRALLLAALRSWRRAAR